MDDGITHNFELPKTPRVKGKKAWRLKRRLGYAGVRVGEAEHPGPGTRRRLEDEYGMVFVSANIEAISTQYGNLTALKQFSGDQEERAGFPTIALLSETRIGRPAAWSGMLKDLGWEGVYGEVQQEIASGAAARIASGGVAVLGPVGLGIRLVEPKSSQARAAWLGGRMVCAAVPRAGSGWIYAICIYGHSGTKKDGYKKMESYNKTEEIIEAALDMAAELGEDVPVVIGGDYNTTVEKSSTMQAAIHAGWHDALADHGDTRMTHKDGNRLDYLLINSTMALATRSASREEERSFPSHFAIQITIEERIWATKIMKRDVAPMAGLKRSKETDEAILQDRSMQELQEQVKTQVMKQDVEQAWKAWNNVAEFYLHRAFPQDPTLTSDQVRGESLPIREATVTASTKATSTQCGSTIKTLERLHRAERLLEELLRAGCAGARKEATWTNLQGITELALNEMVSIPTAEQLSELKVQVKQMRQKGSQSLIATRVHLWRQKLKKSLKDSCRWVRGGGYKKLTYLECDNGERVADMSKIHEELLRKWMPVYKWEEEQKQGSSSKKKRNQEDGKDTDGQRDATPFMQRFGKQITQHPLDMQAITAEAVAEQGTRMQDATAGGADGWRTRDLKIVLRVPQVAEAFAQFLGLCERAEMFPQVWREVVTTMIPKEGKQTRAENMRPISVTSAAYRVWAGIRTAEIIEWQNKWSPDGITGFKKKSGTEDALWLIQQKVAAARMGEYDVSIAAIDFAKCYDKIDWHVTVAAAAARGVPSWLLRLWRNYIAGVKRRHKVGQSLGEEFQCSRGLLQGCPLRVIMLNFITTCLIEELERASASRNGAITATVYADDLTVITEGSGGEQAMKEAMGILKEYTELSFQVVSPTKSLCSSIRRDGRQVQVMYGDRYLQWAECLRILGNDISTTGKTGEGAKGRQAEIERRVVQITRHPRTRPPERALLVTLMITSSLAYEGWGNGPIENGSTEWWIFVQLRAKVLTSIYPKRAQQMSIEIAMTLFHQGHCVDPRQAIVYRLVQRAQRVLAPTKSNRAILDKLGDFGDRISYPIGWLRRIADDRQQTLEELLQISDHDLREYLRNQEWERVRTRRPRQYEGLKNVKRAVTMNLYRYMCDPDEATKKVKKEEGLPKDDGPEGWGSGFLGQHVNKRIAGLRNVMTGAIYTRDRDRRHFNDPISRECPSCPGKVGDEKHRFWDCCAFQHMTWAGLPLRTLVRTRMRSELGDYNETDLSRCFTYCGIVGAGRERELTPCTIRCVQRMMLATLGLEDAEDEAEEEQDDKKDDEQDDEQGEEGGDQEPKQGKKGDAGRSKRKHKNKTEKQGIPHEFEQDEKGKRRCKHCAYPTNRYCRRDRGGTDWYSKTDDELQDRNIQKKAGGKYYWFVIHTDKGKKYSAPYRRTIEEAKRDRRGYYDRYKAAGEAEATRWVNALKASQTLKQGPQDNRTEGKTEEELGSRYIRTLTYRQTTPTYRFEYSLSTGQGRHKRTQIHGPSRKTEEEAKEDRRTTLEILRTEGRDKACEWMKNAKASTQQRTQKTAGKEQQSGQRASTTRSARGTQHRERAGQATAETDATTTRRKRRRPEEQSEHGATGEDELIELSPEQKDQDDAGCSDDDELIVFSPPRGQEVKTPDQKRRRTTESGGAAGPEQIEDRNAEQPGRGGDGGRAAEQETTGTRRRRRTSASHPSALPRAHRDGSPESNEEKRRRKRS